MKTNKRIFSELAILSKRELLDIKGGKEDTPIIICTVAGSGYVKKKKFKNIALVN